MLGVLFTMRKLLLPFLLCLSLTIVESQAGEQNNFKMPSVADVFSGMSEAEIAEQVKQGQEFLEYMEKNGTPEEKAQFEQLLMETLNSMSEADFNDITNIAEMVKPHLDLPSEQPTEVKIETKPEVKAEPTVQDGSLLEELQNTIATITLRIDSIMQKIQSSKEASEYVDTKWKSKTTFNNMKRQIALLRTKRLALKLIAKDLSSDDEKMVAKLKSFLKELTKQNDAFKIEDDFGLPVSHAQEKKYLAQTKEILLTFDDYTDSLMPMLEKFLRKWEPEALEMEKESNAKTKKALTDAKEAAVRKAQPDARPTQPRATGYSPATSSSLGNSGAGNYQSANSYPGSYYDDSGYSPAQYPGYGYGDNENNIATSNSAKKDTAATATNAKGKETQDAEKLSSYDRAMNSLESTTQYDLDQKHEDATVDLLNKIDYPSLVDGANPTGIPNPAADNFVKKTMPEYIDKISGQLTTTLGSEFDSLQDAVANIKQAIVNMTSEEQAKLQSSSAFTKIESRLKRYKDAFEAIDNKLTASCNKAKSALANDTQRDTLEKQHSNFISYLKTDFGTTLKHLQVSLGTIKRTARTGGSRKAKTA